MSKLSDVNIDVLYGIVILLVLGYYFMDHSEKPLGKAFLGGVIRGALFGYLTGGYQAAFVSAMIWGAIGPLTEMLGV